MQTGPFAKGENEHVQRLNAMYTAQLTDNRPPEPHGLARRPLPRWAGHVIAFAAGLCAAWLACRFGL